MMAKNDGKDARPASSGDREKGRETAGNYSAEEQTATVDIKDVV